MAKALEISPLGDGELGRLFGLAKCCFEAAAGWNDRRVLDALTRDVVFVAHEGGVVAGYVALRPDRDRVVVEQIFVAPGHERRGTGHRLRGGRFWLVETVEPAGAEEAARAVAKPARYRLHLRHPDGREELGAFRRFRPGSPRLGHAFATMEDGRPISWEVVDEQLARDDQAEPFLDLLAERDYAEADGELPDHELEHALAAQLDDGLPPAAEAAIAQATEQGLDVELVALEPGEEPDWAEAQRYVDALIFEEIEDDLFEQCGVDPDNDPRD